MKIKAEYALLGLGHCDVILCEATHCDTTNTLLDIFFLFFFFLFSFFWTLLCGLEVFALIPR